MTKPAPDHTFSVAPMMDFQNNLFKTRRYKDPCADVVLASGCMELQEIAQN